MTRRARILSLVLLFLVLATPAVHAATHLLVPSFNQAYRNSAGYWGSCPMGTGGCPDRIATAGCLITAFAMVLDYYGVDLSVPAGSSCTGTAQYGMDPGILNDWLRTHGGYGRCSTDPSGSCCLEWTALPSQVQISMRENTRSTGLDATAQRTIDQALAAGHPVICGVHWGSHCHGTTTQTEDCHWIVLTGRLGTTYSIIDPYNQDTHDPHGVTTTLDHGVFGAYTIDRYVVVSGAVPTPAVQGLRLTLSFSPKGAGTYAPDTAQERFIRVSGATGDPVLLFARAIDPQGTIRYAYYTTSSPAPGTPLSLSKDRRSLYPSPVVLTNGLHEWNETRLAAGDAGTWTWDVWAEDPSRPGLAIAEDMAAYTIASAARPMEATGPVLVAAALALLITAAIYGLVLLQNQP
jgi:hypothetical protein